MLHRLVTMLLVVLLISATSHASDLGNDLRKAAEKGDLAKAHRLLSEGADVNAKDGKGVTALMLAAGKGHAEVVQALLDAGADVEAKDNNGLTAAMLAERNGHSDIVKLLNKPRSGSTEANTSGIPCASIKIKSDKAEGKQERLFSASERRVKEVVTDAMLATGFVVKKENGQTLEATRRYPELGGGGAGGEKLKVSFETVRQADSSVIRITAETKKGFVGRLRQHNWTDTVPDQAECLLSLFDLRTDEEILSENTAQPDGANEQAGEKITLPDGAPIKLRLRRYLIAKDAKAEKRIAFQVADDVLVDGRVAIKKGAIGWGQVTNAKDIGFVGRNAKLNFVIDSVKAMDGRQIPVRSAAKDAGGGTSGSRIAQGYLAAGGLGAIFSQGKQVGVRAGAEFIVFSNGAQSLKLKAGPD